MKIYDPHIADITVLDNSIPEDELETPSIDTALGVLFATFSSRGRHNKIIECRTSSLIKTTFGDDFGNYDKYGMTNLLALRVAKSGGRSFICSLIPDDAKVAYSVFGVTVKDNAAIPVYKRTDTVLNATGTAITSLGVGSYILNAAGEKQQIMLKAAEGDSEATVPATVTGVSLKVETKELQSVHFDAKGNPTAFNGEPIVSEDSEGNREVFYPLFTSYYYSKGKGGNYFGYRIQRNTARDKKVSDGRRYSLSFYEILSTGTVKPMFDGETYDFSFNKDAVYSDVDATSEALSKVYVNLDANSDDKAIQVIPYEAGYDALIATLSEKGVIEETDEQMVDILNGVFVNGVAYNKIVMDDASVDVVNTLITFDNGSDGSLEVGFKKADGTFVTAEDVEKTKSELLVKFFSCDVDNAIFDEKMIDADIAPDTMYPDEVKQTMMAVFSTYRPDIALPIGLGIDHDPNEAIAKYRELNSYVNTDYSYMCSFFAQSGYLNDVAIDGSAREVTSIYDYIAGLADNFATANGAFQMRAGANRGKVRYMTPYYVCTKDKANTIETLEDLGINNIQYLNKSKDMVYMLESSQYTIDNSKLMSNRNALVVGRIIRMCCGILPYYKYDERNITTTLQEAKGELERNTGLARIPSNIEVNYDLYQTKADAKEENAHCAIEVSFPDYVKKFHVVISCKRQTPNA